MERIPRHQRSSRNLLNFLAQYFSSFAHCVCARDRDRFAFFFLQFFGRWTGYLLQPFCCCARACHNLCWSKSCTQNNWLFFPCFFPILFHWTTIHLEWKRSTHTNVRRTCVDQIIFHFRFILLINFQTHFGFYCANKSDVHITYMKVSTLYTLTACEFEHNVSTEPFRHINICELNFRFCAMTFSICYVLHAMYIVQCTVHVLHTVRSYKLSPVSSSDCIKSFIRFPEIISVCWIKCTIATLHALCSRSTYQWSCATAMISSASITTDMQYLLRFWFHMRMSENK